MKKTLWGILILVVLTGCEEKKSNNDPKYEGIDNAIESIIDTMNNAPYKDSPATFKIEHASKLFGIAMYTSVPSMLPENCTQEKLSAYHSKLSVGATVNENIFDIVRAMIPVVCEDGVYKKEKYDAESQVLYSYAKKKFTDEFVEK